MTAPSFFLAVNLSFNPAVSQHAHYYLMTTVSSLLNSDNDDNNVLPIKLPPLTARRVLPVMSQHSALKSLLTILFRSNSSHIVMHTTRFDSVLNKPNCELHSTMQLQAAVSCMAFWLCSLSCHKKLFLYLMVSN